MNIHNENLLEVKGSQYFGLFTHSNTLLWYRWGTAK